MPFVILRFYQIYGPYQSINRLIPFVIDSSLKDRQFKCSPGHQLRDFLYVNDAISAVLKSLKNIFLYTSDAFCYKAIFYNEKLRSFANRYF